MAIGIITGSGTYALPGFEGERPGAGRDRVGRGARLARDVRAASTSSTSRATARATCGSATTSRTGRTSARCAQAGVDAVLAVTVCGAVDPDVELGSLICFDDLHFVVNRLPDGSLCTFYAEPGDPRRGALDLRGPVLARRCAPRCSPAPRRRGSRCATAAATATSTARASTPRRRSAGSRRAASPPSRRPPGRRPCSCGEAELPFALVGYATDYANGVSDEATPVERLLELIAASTGDVRAAARGDAPAHRRAALAPAGRRLPLPRGMTPRRPRSSWPARRTTRPRCPASRRPRRGARRRAPGAADPRARRGPPSRRPTRASRSCARRRRRCGGATASPRRHGAARASGAAASVAACCRGVELIEPRDLDDAIAQVGAGRCSSPAPRARGSAPRTPTAALADLRAGCDFVFGATLDGGWYLAGLREPRPELLSVAALRERRHRRRRSARARELGAEVGMLRHERVLATPRDAAALIADPLVDDALPRRASALDADRSPRAAPGDAQLRVAVGRHRPGRSRPGRCSAGGRTRRRSGRGPRSAPTSRRTLRAPRSPPRLPRSKSRSKIPNSSSRPPSPVSTSAPVNTTRRLPGRRSDGSRRRTLRRSSRPRTWRSVSVAAHRVARRGRAAAARTRCRYAWRWPRPDLHVRLHAGHVQVGGLVGVDQRERAQQVGARRRRDDVAGAERIGDVGHVAVAEARRPLALLERDRVAAAAGEPRGRAAEDRAGRLGDRERRHEREDRACRSAGRPPTRRPRS